MTLNIKVDLSGEAELMRNLLRLDDRAHREIQDSLDDGAHMLRDDIIKDILHGPKTGRVYTHHMEMEGGKLVQGKKRSAPHQASAPGEAPASDTGHLVGNITVDQSRAPDLDVGVQSLATHSEELEFGRRSGPYPMEARPFMRPAFERKTQAIVQDLTETLRRVLRRAR